LAVALTGSSGSGPRITCQCGLRGHQFCRIPAIDLVVPADDPTLQIDLPASIFPFDYNISLHDGWTLNSINADAPSSP